MSWPAGISAALQAAAEHCSRAVAAARYACFLEGTSYSVTAAPAARNAVCLEVTGLPVATLSLTCVHWCNIFQMLGSAHMQYSLHVLPLLRRQHSV